MKRFFTYCLLAVTLFVGVTATSVFRNEHIVPNTGLTGHQRSLPDQRQSSFTANDLFLSVGMGNEQIRLTHSLQNLSFRVLPSLSNASRIIHSTQLVHQKFFTGYTIFLLKSAFKQLDGYYLYYLRKLLI